MMYNRIFLSIRVLKIHHLPHNRTYAIANNDVLEDPGTNQPFATCPDMSVEDVDAAVQAAGDAFTAYRTYTPLARSLLLSKWDTLIRENKEDIARILVHETGKPLAEARGEIDYATGFTRWFAGEAERIQGTTYPAAIPGRRIFTLKQPIGVVAALVPWNFPVAMILRKASAAFAAGCTMVAKPSPETPLTALTLAYLAEKAGYPKGVFNVLPTTLHNTPALSEALCKHPVVKKVSFTGSVRILQDQYMYREDWLTGWFTKDARWENTLGALCGWLKEADA